MPIFFNNTQNATRISSPVRVISIYDPVTGCPNSSRTNPLLTTTINIQRPSFFRVMGSMIRFFNGRSDLFINIQGPAGSNYSTNNSTPRLNWTSANIWDCVVFDAGYYGDTAGNWTISLTAANPGSYGCNRQWGKMFIMVFEV